MVLTTYGRSSGFCIDPIEKKPLNHFLPGSGILSFGTAGCNLRCKFCQNWTLSSAREMDILAARATPEQIAQAAVETGCRSVAFTYNDPIIFLEYAVDIARACHERDVRTVAVTAGYIEGDARAEFFGCMDAANIDLKSFSDDFYRRLCGASLQPVLDTLLYVKRNTGCWMELTTLLIPGENDSDEELDAMTRWVVKELGPEVPMHFTAYRPAHHFRERPATSPEILTRARDIAQRNGVRYAFTGNVYDPDGGSTHCILCGRVVIGRAGFNLTAWDLDEQGNCKHCGAHCDGVFDDSPGQWNGRCCPVRV
jgi:pyruvate formate lyase activating enzyme